MVTNSRLLSVLFLGLCFQNGSTTRELSNDQPIIGVLEQAIDEVENKTTYISGAYVSFIEGGGGRVIRIKVNQTDEYYTNIFASINGLVVPGGNVDLDNSGYATAAKKLFNLAMAANDEGDYFPIWGACLGFEFLAVAVAGVPSMNLLRYCDAHEKALPLTFELAANSSRLFGNAPASVVDTLANSPSTGHFHHKCVTTKMFDAFHLGDFYNVLTTARTRLGFHFVSNIEAKNYPFWGVAYHPEKTLYEWYSPAIPHSAAAVESAQYFARFFVNQARKSGHAFPSPAEEDKYLIYNDQPIFARVNPNISFSFERMYIY